MWNMYIEKEKGRDTFNTKILDKVPKVSVSEWEQVPYFFGVRCKGRLQEGREHA